MFSGEMHLEGRVGQMHEFITDYCSICIIVQYFQSLQSLLRVIIEKNGLQNKNKQNNEISLSQVQRVKKNKLLRRKLFFETVFGGSPHFIREVIFIFCSSEAVCM